MPVSKIGVVGVGSSIVIPGESVDLPGVSEGWGKFCGSFGWFSSAVFSPEPPFGVGVMSKSPLQWGSSWLNSSI